MKVFTRSTAVLLMILTVAALSVLAQTGKVTFEPYVFESAKGEKVDAELGKLIVPEDRRALNGKQIELAFVRFKQMGSGKGNPIVYLAGGPGGSGIGAARGSRFSLFMAMREFGDVIALDQRGTGLSKPSLGCKQKLDLPPNVAGIREEMIARVTERAEVCRQQLTVEGIDLSAYNTEANADDIESLRIALGVEKLSLWSISYGTHLALAAIKRHPQSFDRAIMAGVNGLDDRRKLPSDAEAALLEVSRLSKRDPELSVLIPDVHALMAKVLADLDKGPITAEVVNPQTKQPERVGISKFDVQFITAQSLGSARFVRSIPALYYAMAKGDYTEIASMVAGMKFNGMPGSAMFYTMDCASGASAERYARIAREEKDPLLGDAFNFLFKDVCSTWKVKDLGSDFRSPVRSDIPVLMISGTLDGRTPPARAEDVRKGLRNGVHLIVEGASHDDDLWFSSPVIKESMMVFMKGEKLQATRTVAVEPAIKFRMPQR